MLRIGFLEPVKILLRWLILKYARLAAVCLPLLQFSSQFVPLSIRTHLKFQHYALFWFLKKNKKSAPPSVKPTRLLHQRRSLFAATRVSNATDGEKGRRRIGVLRLLVCLIIYFMYYGTPRINLCPFCACLHNSSNRSTRYVNKRREVQELIYGNITHVIFLFLVGCFAWLVSLRRTDHSIQPFIPSLK